MRRANRNRRQNTYSLYILRYIRSYAMVFVYVFVMWPMDEEGISYINLIRGSDDASVTVSNVGRLYSIYVATKSTSFAYYLALRRHVDIWLVKAGTCRVVMLIHYTMEMDPDDDHTNAHCNAGSWIDFFPSVRFFSVSPRSPRFRLPDHTMSNVCCKCVCVWKWSFWEFLAWANFRKWWLRYDRCYFNISRKYCLEKKLLSILSKNIYFFNYYLIKN